MNNGGSLSILIYRIIVPMIRFLGLAVHASTLWMVNQRLRWSADTAALLGAGQLRYGVPTAQVHTDAQSLFLANVSPLNLMQG